MESLVMALRGLFLRRMPARMNREQTSGAPGGPPPLGPYLVRGSQSGPRLRAPPAGRASALAGDPSPWPAPAAFNIRRPGMAAAHTAATLFFGGSVWRPVRRSGAGSSVLYCRRWGKGRPPGGRWLQRYRLGQVCALAESACLRPSRPGGRPCPGFKVSKTTDFNGEGHPSWVSLTLPSLPYRYHRYRKSYRFIDNLSVSSL